MSLNSLGGHPGWAAFCERMQRLVEQEIDAKIFDPSTPDEACRDLRRARKLLVGAFSPESVRRSMVSTLETQLRQRDGAAGRGG